MNRTTATTLLVACLIACQVAVAARPDGQLELTIVDDKTGEPTAARMTLRNARGRAVKLRGVGVAPLGDHFYADGRVLLKLRRGQYTFTLDAGPEHYPQSGHFEIERRAEDTKQVRLRRAADLAREGWVGADLDAPRTATGFATARRAEHLAHPTRVNWHRDNGEWVEIDKSASPHTGAAWGTLRFYRPGAMLAVEQLKQIDGVGAEQLVALREDDWRVIAADLTDWRLPVWLAYDVLDAAMVIDRASLTKREPRPPAGYPRDTTLYPGVRGMGRWRETIYFHALNAGLRLPPVAGSGSGDNEQPLGAARVYAQSAREPGDTDTWWDAVDAGATFVTTGPLLRPSVDGRPPGWIFRLASGATTDFQIGLNLTTRDKIEYLELLRNGEVAAAVPLRDVAKSGGRLPPLAFDEPGWFAVRATPVDGKGIYHRAFTAPFYVTQADQPRISKQSCQFFLAWLDELAKRQEATPAEIAAARTFWAERLTQATAP